MFNRERRRCGYRRAAGRKAGPGGGFADAANSTKPPNYDPGLVVADLITHA